MFLTDTVLEWTAALFNKIDQDVKMHKHAAVSVMSVDELLLQCNSLWILGKQFALLTKWMLGALLVRKWGMQIYGPCKFSEPFLLKSKLIWGSYSTMYLVYSKIKTSLSQSSCHGSGKVKDLEGSLKFFISFFL